MPSLASPLSEILDQEIESAGGALPFVRFMELALYHPEHGYYAAGRARIGKEGDFFTSISVGKIYGELLASVAFEIWDRMGCPDDFSLIEQGAHDGTLAEDILASIISKGGPFSDALRYVIVEPFPINRTRQEAKLQSLHTLQKISWVGSVEELPNFTGIHLSNELLDAFPVHSLRWDGIRWLQEYVVKTGPEKLVLGTQEFTDPELEREASFLPKSLPVGFRVEVNPGIRPWLRSLYERMDGGVVLTIDYGQAGEDRYAPHRADGTLVAYQAHQRFHDPLPEPGMRDITAQVDFTSLAAQARGLGFEILGYSDQHHFLVGAAEPWLRSLGDSLQGDLLESKQPDLRALQTLLNPGILGRQFKAIALSKNFKATPQLSCFLHQRPGVDVL